MDAEDPSPINDIIETIDNFPSTRIKHLLALASFLQDETSDDRLYDVMDSVHERFAYEPASCGNNEFIYYTIGWPDKWKIADKIRQTFPFLLLFYEYKDNHGFDYDRNGISFFDCIGDFAIWKGDQDHLHHPFTLTDMGTNYKDKIPFELCRHIELWKSPFTINELDDESKLNDFALYLQLLWLGCTEENNEAITGISHRNLDVRVEDLKEFKALLSLGNKHTDYLDLARKEITFFMNNLAATDAIFEAVISKPASLLDYMTWAI